METTKVCRFLIVIFLALTVFFTVMFFNENETEVSKEFVDGAVSNLNSQGIEISADVIETRVPDEDIYVLAIDNINEHNNRLIDAIVSNLFDFETVKSVFDVPDGSSVSIYSTDNPDKEIASILFSETDISFNFSKNGVNISGADYPLMNDILDDIDDDKYKIITSILDELISGNGISYRISGSTGNDGMLIVSAIQTIDEYDINNMYMNFVFVDEELVAVMGNWFYGNHSAEYHEQLVDGVNVLYKLDIENVSKIHGEEIVYTLRKADDTFFLIPGWMISYTDKEGNYKTAFFDAL